ncbi:hypothetical protein PN290_00355 [Romboutsia sp. 1001216sp1]|uniref:hypothetical protein n=1 Tax=unclassified Romboutsia TaxID=2626894 RepID=UPI0018A90DAB|nr:MULTISPECIES: hypothetical protein [unclassified Romboutsia]MDB8794265.1 hypothetical protein [Romboutsia sp. 1001216sp1]MDB8796434.1 hypothetical protein [Romboutsia sp. 1001216sp1]MDB8797813.1 hypothetical protein [Romboutsia sp. 1001216sp1]
MVLCKTCGKDNIFDFGCTECDSCSRKRYAVKDGKEIYGHITTLMKECDISFKQAIEIIKIVNLHEISEGLSDIRKAVYDIGE